MVAVSDHLDAAALLAMGYEGTGTEAEPKCPHCGTNHEQNGYSMHEPQDGCHHDAFVHCCLGCGNEWGEAIPSNDFATAYAEAGGHQPRQMCAALRTVARNWGGTRQAYVNHARNMGINEITAGRSWQMAGRNKKNESK